MSRRSGRNKGVMLPYQEAKLKRAYMELRKFAPEILDALWEWAYETQRRPEKRR